MTTGDPRRLHPGDLPTPFTADEIRDGCRPGRELRMRIERAGQDPIIRVVRYLVGDETTAIQETWEESVDGVTLREPEVHREMWLDLQDHASFPADSTVVADETIEIPAGTFACLRYTQTVDDGTRTFWFAKDLPGQPVHWVIRAGGEAVVTVTLLENSPAPG